MFGIELEVLLARQVQSDQIPQGTIPTVIENCLVEIENRGLTEVGICECLHLLFGLFIS